MLILNISISQIKPQSSLSGLGLMLAYMHVDTISYLKNKDCTECVAMYFRQFIEVLLTQKHKYPAL